MRFLLFAVLLTAVYSWEEISYLTSRLWHKLRKKNNNHYGSDGSDKFVTAGLMYFAIPLTLIYYLAGDGGTIKKLFLLSVQLILIAVLAAGIKKFAENRDMIGKYQGLEKIGAVGYALSGFVSPLFLMFRRHAATEHELVGRFALFLSLPALAGLVIAFMSPKDIITGDILPNMNSLLVVMVGGLFVNVTVHLLEKHLRLNAANLLSYFRIILGILILVVLSQGLVN
jgi:hypothetical protein